MSNSYDDAVSATLVAPCVASFHYVPDSTWGHTVNVNGPSSYTPTNDPGRQEFPATTEGR